MNRIIFFMQVYPLSIVKSIAITTKLLNFYWNKNSLNEQNLSMVESINNDLLKYTS